MKILAILISFIPLNFIHAACEKSGLEIMKAQEKKQSANSEEETQDIVILDMKSKKKEKRTLKRYLIKEGEKKSKGLLFFNDPTTIKGAGLLNWKNLDEEDQWLYIPEIKKLTRIVGGNKKNYFMGTDFTYADLEGEDIDNNNYKCLKEIACQNGKSSCFAIEAKPKTEERARNIGYMKRLLLIDKKNLYTLKIVFYNLKGKKLKTARYSNWKQVDNVWRPDFAKMERHNVQTTFIKIKSRKLNSKINEIVFAKRYLQKEMHIK